MTIELSNFSFISQFNKSGRKGAGGNRGAGGKPGGPSKVLSALCFKYFTETPSEREYTDVPFFGYAKRPINGLNGINSAGIENPAQPKAFPKSYKIHYHAVAITQYKTYLRESSSDPERTNSLLQFHNLIDRNFRVRKMYNTPGFFCRI